MLEWLTYNIGSILLLLILAGGVTALVVYLIKQKKQGKSSCSCGCQNCAMKCCCHQEKK